MIRTDAAVHTVLMTADTIGGVWAYALDLAKGLREFDIQVLLVTMGRPCDAHQQERIDALDNVIHLETAYKLEWMDDPWDDVAEAGRFLLETAADFDPDIIHLNGYCHAGLPFDRPVLAVGHSCVYSWYEAVYGKAPPAAYRTYYERTRQGLQSADLVVAPSRAMLAALNRFYGRFRAARMIYNGSAVVPPVQPKEPFVLTAGRLWDAGKNIECLRKAAARIEQPVLMAGQDTHPDNGGRAVFNTIRPLGKLTPSQLTDVMSRASVFALPACYEPFGLSILEAGRCGCALVVGDIQSLREIWGDAAVYVACDDAAQLARQINRLTANPEMLDIYARKARRRAARYTIRRMVSAYVTAYDELAGAGQAVSAVSSPNDLFMKGQP